MTKVGATLNRFGFSAGSAASGSSKTGCWNADDMDRPPRDTSGVPGKYSPTDRCDFNAREAYLG